LQIFLKEKGKMTLKEMRQAAANYFDAHGYQNNIHHDAIGQKGQASSKSSDVKVTELKEKLLIQSDEQKEVIPSNVKGGAPRPPTDHEDHEGHQVAIDHTV